jgi:hypothetical protein
MILIAAASAILAATNQSRIEVPFRIADNAIIVDAELNGKKVSVMFDSGFSGAFVLNQSINVGKPTGKINLQDFVGVFSANTVEVSSLKFGGKAIEPGQMQIVQQPMKHMSVSYGTHCDGIMGFEVISGQVVEINFEQKKFIFHPESHDISALPADGKTTFLAKMLPIGMNSIEMRVGASNGKRMILALDTGNAFYAVTHRDVLEKLGLWKEGNAPKFMGQSWVASGPVKSWSLMMKDTKIYGVPVDESVWSIIDLPSSSASHDGTVGFGFLKNFNITVDMNRRRVRLENFTGKASSVPQADVGLFATYDSAKKRMRIAVVVPGGPADKAGIKVGDDLLAVGLNDVGILSYRNLQAMLKGDLGSTVTVDISRAGKYTKYKLERAYLFNEAETQQAQ